MIRRYCDICDKEIRERDNRARGTWVPSVYRNHRNYHLEVTVREGDAEHMCHDCMVAILTSPDFAG